PSHVWLALVDMAHSGELLRDLTASLQRAFLGLFLGTIAGVAIGLLTGRVAWWNAYWTPLIQLARPLPPVAIIPLVITWLGITETAKVFSIAFAVFFPVWINTHLGAMELPRTYLWTAASLRIGTLQTFWRIILPGALPFVVAGFR